MHQPIVFTEEQFFHYVHCPIHYDTIYNKKFSPAKNINMNALLCRVAKSFYTRLLEGAVMPTSEIKKRWDKLCEQNQDIITPQKGLDGLGQLMKMYTWAEKVQLRIVDQDIPYSMLLHGKDGMLIDFRGHIDTIAMDKDNKLYILVLDFGNRYPQQSYIDMKMKFSLDSLAFDKVYNKIAGIKVHHVKNDKDFYSLRKKEDYARIEKAIGNVVFAVKNELFYPRETVFCTSCDLIHFCKAWS